MNLFSIVNSSEASNITSPSSSDASNASTETFDPTISIAVNEPLERDMAELHALHAYYVNNTRRSPFFNVGSVDSFKKYLEKLDSRNLPFLVALPVDAHPEDTPNPKEERILGYIYLAPYGSEGLGIAFASTVELFVYVHPEYTGLGIGTCLMYGMLADLNTMPYWPHTAVEEHLNGETSEITYAEVKNVVVSIPMDPDDEEEGHVLAAWFVSKFGFQLTGTLHKVCFKLGKWYDVLQIQYIVGPHN